MTKLWTGFTQRDGAHLIRAHSAVSPPARPARPGQSRGPGHREPALRRTRSPVVARQHGLRGARADPAPPRLRPGFRRFPAGIPLADWSATVSRRPKRSRAKITDRLRGTLRRGHAGQWSGGGAAAGCHMGPWELANGRTSVAGWGMIGEKAPDV